MTIEELASELGLEESVSVERILQAYERVCDSCRSTITNSSEKAERRMAKQKLKELERELGPSIESVKIKAEIEEALKEIQEVMKEGFGSTDPYFAEIDKLLPACVDNKLKLRVSSLRTAAKEFEKASRLAATQIPFNQAGLPEKKEIKEANLEPLPAPEPKIESSPSTKEIEAEDSGELKRPLKPVESEKEEKSEKISESKTKTESASKQNHTEELENALETVKPTIAEQLNETVAKGFYCGKKFSKVIGGVKTHIHLGHSIRFGRQGFAAADVEMPLQSQVVPPDKLKTFTNSISRLHFQIINSAGKTDLYDGSFLSDGSRKKSAGGIYWDGEKVDEMRLDDIQPGLLTLINSDLKPERPAFKVKWIEAAGVNSELRAASCLKDYKAFEQRSLLLTRAEALSERVLCLWGPVSLASLGPKLEGHIFIPIEEGFLVWHQSEGLLSREAVDSLLKF